MIISSLIFYYYKFCKNKTNVQDLDQSFLVKHLKWHKIKNLKIKNDDYEVVDKIAFTAENNCYTQGFKFYNWEQNTVIVSCGLYKESKIYLLSLDGLQITKLSRLDDKYFAEGADWVQLDSQKLIYQLTYKERDVLVYDYDSLKFQNKIRIPDAIKQGWGMLRIDVNGQSKFLVTDGSKYIYQLDAKTFQIEKKTQVYRLINGAKDPIIFLNEMEMIDGFLFINVYTTPYILKVDYNSGNVLKVYDMNRIVKEVKNTPYFKNNLKDVQEFCLNGIAHNNRTRKTYLSGKKWPIIYQVQFN